MPPGNAFFVKTAAKSGVGLSSATRVSVIFAGFGASAGVNSKREPPTLNPAGRLACALSHARCEARSANTICVLGMSRGVWARGRGVKPNFYGGRRKMLWKCAATLL